MTNFSDLNYDILFQISMYLPCQDFCTLTQCNHYLNKIQWVDSIWKRFCQQDFHIQYNHPDQTFRELYFQCRQEDKRPPCPHLQCVSTEMDRDFNITWTDELQCERCFVKGTENLLVCLAPQCRQILCDRHARCHTRKIHLEQQQDHSLYYKPNMSELFCQTCVDWIGGIDANPAEQYRGSTIATNWLHTVYGSNHHIKQRIVEYKHVRQAERNVRWRDTPQSIMNNKMGFCFISTSWMAEWEMFIEGWVTEPPNDVLIDQTSLLSSVARLDFNDASPFSLTSVDEAMIISNETWDYISKKYKVKGKQITEDDLKPRSTYQAMKRRIELWKSRASSF